MKTHDSSPLLHILVVEDHPVMRDNLATLLTLEGYEVTIACNGKKAVEAAGRRAPDLVLCDVMMPELDGHEVLRILRSLTATAATPFIFLTARGEKSDVRAGMNLGADDYLTKPVANAELLEAIAARLERQRVIHLRQQFHPDFSSARPLESLDLTPREAEVLLWTAQGKGNAVIADILQMTEGTVKKHLQHIFEKLGVENRSAAALRALETLPHEKHAPKA
jgi:DNA-binding NarL/FixJ family response regulator